MRWFPEAAPRLVEWRRRKMCTVLAEAGRQAHEGQQHRQEAAELRQSVTEVRASLFEGKSDLSRARLLEWLRTLAVVRAHVLESEQHIGLLEDAAATCARLEAELRQEAAFHQRKIRRVEEVCSRMTSSRDRRLERTAERISQEEYACRPR